jgi:hypothetical protein
MDMHEHEFTQTANSLQQIADLQRESLDAHMENGSTPEGSTLFEELDSSVQRTREFAQIFCQSDDSAFAPRKSALIVTSSPMIYPHMEPEAINPKYHSAPLSLSIEDRMDSGFVWRELQSPETLALDELDHLFQSY